MLSLGSLEDVHILELSKRITNEPDLMELGVKVLELPDFIVKQRCTTNEKSNQPVMK